MADVEPIQMTDAAVNRVRVLLREHGKDAVGLRLAVKPTGCSGLTYKMEFAREIEATDAVLEFDDVRLVVDPSAAVFLSGTEVDFVEDRLGSSFKFNNPNEKARCGCGESFTV